jgi:hypothetical protein
MKILRRVEFFAPVNYQLDTVPRLLQDAAKQNRFRAHGASVNKTNVCGPCCATNVREEVENVSEVRQVMPYSSPKQQPIICQGSCAVSFASWAESMLAHEETPQPTHPQLI